MVEGSKESMENDTTMDEDSTEEPEKEHTSGDEATAEETIDEEKHDEKNVDEDEDEEEEERDREKDESEEESESEYSESEESDSFSVVEILSTLPMSLNEGEAEDRRQKYVSDMSDLEKQFADLKEQLYKERITQIDDQLGKVTQMNWEKKKKNSVNEITNHAYSMDAKEYTGPLKQLENDCHIRTEVAGFLKHYKMINLENQLQCELQSAEQHFQNEERDLCNALMAEFEEKLRKAEEERHTAEMYSDLWCDDSFRNRKKRKGMEIFIPEKRKKTCYRYRALYCLHVK